MEWRSAGRSSEISYPAKKRKLESQRNLQKIARESESIQSLKQHNDLMETHINDISRLCKMLKEIHGDQKNTLDIHFIEKLNGMYSGQNVLEGFRVKTATMEY